MGLVKKQFKVGMKMSRIKSQLKKKPSKGLTSAIPKAVNINRKTLVKKSKKLYYTGEIKEAQHLHSKRQYNKLKTTKSVLNTHDSGSGTFLRSKAVNDEPNNKHTLKLEDVKVCVSAMLKFESKNSKSKGLLLFKDEAQPIHMIVQCVRVPIMKNKNYRFCLPNPLVDESSDICLFVPNLKKGKKEDHEPTIEHYQDILKKHKVQGISQIIPLRQIQVEFDQYELRRRLVNQFDMFLADGRITGHVQGLLGKEIHKKRKLPIPVDMRVKDLKKEIDTALSKTLLMMNGFGDKASLRVGHTKQSVPEIARNIIAVAEGLTQCFPGGWENIRSLKIHLQDCVPVPIYISLKNSNDVEVPVVSAALPKKAVPVEGELSTIAGVHVTVLPDGEIIVKKKTLTKRDKELGFSESDLEDYDSNEEMDVNSSDEKTALRDEVKIDPLPIKEEKEDDNTDSDVSSVGGDEHVVDAAENAYLNEWREQWNENIKENNKKRKEETVDEEVKDAPQTKKPKIVKDKKKKKTAKKVKSKEIENVNFNISNMDPQLKKKNKKKNLTSANIASHEITSSKKLNLTSQKTTMKPQSSKNIAKKQKYSKSLVSQKKKKKSVV